jgi:hypothetical protein
VFDEGGTAGVCGRGLFPHALWAGQWCDSRSELVPEKRACFSIRAVATRARRYGRRRGLGFLYAFVFLARKLEVCARREDPSLFDEFTVDVDVQCRLACKGKYEVPQIRSD